MVLRVDLAVPVLPTSYPDRPLDFFFNFFAIGKSGGDG